MRTLICGNKTAFQVMRETFGVGYKSVGYCVVWFHQRVPADGILAAHLKVSRNGPLVPIYWSQAAMDLGDE